MLFRALCSSFFAVELGVVFHPEVHLFSLVCDHLSSDGFQSGSSALGWAEHCLYAIMHSRDVTSCCSHLDLSTELCPVFIGTMSDRTLNLASG